MSLHLVIQVSEASSTLGLIIMENDTRNFYG